MALTPLPLSDSTLNHLRSLPPTLQSLSPPLAALHLARLRLSLEMSATTMGVMSRNLKASGGWCHLCGGLREGLGGAQRGGRRKSTPASPAAASSNTSNTSPLTVTLAEAASTSYSPSNQRRKGQCTTCGAPYEKPKPDISTIRTYPPARRTRRERLSQAQNYAEASISAPEQAVTLEKTVQPEAVVYLSPPSYMFGDAESAPVETSLLFTNLGEAMRSNSSFEELLSASLQNEANKMDVDVADNSVSQVDPMVDGSSSSSGVITNDAPMTETIAAAASSAASPLSGASSPSVADFMIPRRPTLLSRPSLSHIPNSSPNLPTHPPPSPRVPNTTSRKVGAAGGGVNTGGKRKKKSGLAKLLAENKERSDAAEREKGGMWGLD